MDQMPDDVLLAVLQFLTMKRLFVCRLVCRRWASLALHPDVWRHRTLYDIHPRASAVLHLAPCLRELWVTGEGRSLTLPLTTTRCAVESLVLSEPDEEKLELWKFNDMECSLILRNQESLGRLKELSLIFPFSLPAADILVRTIATCVGLQSLRISDPIKIKHPVTRGPHGSSLTLLSCSIWDDQSRSFVHTLLEGHADTLEKFIGSVRYSCSDDPHATARLLGAMPKLRDLSTRAMPGIHNVAACKTLKNLDLDVGSDPTAIEELAVFLRLADQLRDIYMDYISCPDEFHSSTTVLLEALTSSERPLLEILAFNNNYLTDPRPLFSGLYRLPGLRYLDMCRAPISDEMLLRVTPATAPALRTLKLSAKDEECGHVWLHKWEVKALVRTNPLLHVHLLARPMCTRQDCESCALDCHRELSGVEFGFGLFSHDPDACLSPKDHSDPWITWVHM